MVPNWFLYLTGFSMLLLGGLQIYHRPRPKNSSAYQRFVNVGTLWSLVCMSVGAALLAIALGYWRGPIEPTRAPTVPERHYH